MGGSAGGVSSPLVTAATGGQNILLDKTLEGAGVQGGLQGATDKLGNEVSSAFGAGIDKPQLANIQQPYTVDQINQGQAGVNNSLQSQQALLSALQAQNGIGQQNAALQGLQGTASQYQNIANGQGPNPAQAMLNQATGQNVANQAALMAGQRGAGANVGMMARQAGQAGANAQQQAAGQGATMQANQSLNALQGLSGVQNNIGSMANTMAANQMSGTNANTQANLANQQQLQNALAAQNNANVASQGSVNAANAGLLNTAMQGKQKGVFGGVQALGTAVGMAGGGMVHMAEGGEAPAGPKSSFGQFLQGWTSSDAAPVQAPPVAQFTPAQPSEDKSESPVAGKKPGIMEAMGMGGARGGLAKSGGHVAAKTPSQKAEKSGNSYSNDKIPTMLSEGEIVLPRSVTQSKDPKGAAAAFVAQVLAKRKVKK